MEIKITDKNFKEEILESNLPALVDFWAPWCGYCINIAPIIEEIAEEYKGKLKVAKLDVDESPEIASKYDIMTIPTLIIFKDGNAVEKMIAPASKKHIEEIIKNFTDGSD